MSIRLDYSIIWKQLNGQLSEKEQEQLDEWISASHKHEAYYKDALKFYELGEKPVDISRSSLRKLKSKVGFATPLRTYRRYYAAAACGLILLSSVFLWQQVLHQIHPANQVSQEYLKSGKEVMLITSTGDKVLLSNDQISEVKDDHAVVSSLDNGLKYLAKDTGDGPINFNTLVIPRGEFFNLELADGTKVWLNSESVLKYPSKFRAGSRNVDLVGEAYFEVAKDPDNPFYLTSGSQTISVLGTAFNVTAYPDEPNLLTTLVEGSVKVEDDRGESELLTPGDQLVLNKNSGQMSKSIVEVHKFISWKDGILMFEDLELEFILQKVSRWYDVQLFYENEMAARKKFTGRIKRYDNVSKSLDMLKATGTVDFKISGDAVIIK